MAVSFEYSFDGLHWRPSVSLILTSNERVSVQTTALLDTGADTCLFPTQLVSPLGLKLSQMDKRYVLGVGGKPEPAFFDTVTMDLGNDIMVQAEVGFSSGLNVLRTGLLGQKGFFDHFKVCFDLPNRQFTIT